MKEVQQWRSWSPISHWNKLPSSPGIYEIKNTNSGLSYVGSAKALKKRNHYSMLSRGSSHNDDMQKAFNEDGEKAFQFRVLEFCEKDALFETEQKYMDQRDFNMLYNTQPQAGTGRGYTFTDEQREKLSRAERSGWSAETTARVWVKGQERAFKTGLYKELFKDFKKTDEYKSLVKEIKDYADAAPNRYEIIMDHDGDGNEYPLGNYFEDWWLWAGGREYMEKKFEASKCNWEYVYRNVASYNKDYLRGEQGCGGDDEVYSLIAESIFHRNIESHIEAAFQEAVRTGEVKTVYPY